MEFSHFHVPGRGGKEDIVVSSIVPGEQVRHGPLSLSFLSVGRVYVCRLSKLFKRRWSIARFRELQSNNLLILPVYAVARYRKQTPTETVVIVAAPRGGLKILVFAFRVRASDLGLGCLFCPQFYAVFSSRSR